MITNIQSEIKELEDYIGFPVKRKEITFEAKESHDETLSYGLCQRFYGKDKELKIAIKKTENILINLIKFGYNKKKIALFFSLLGDMYYIEGDFNRSINCFRKALSYNKVDITNWVGLIFSLRAIGEFKLFENGIFNFKELCTACKHNISDEFTKEEFTELLKKIISPSQQKERYISGGLQLTRYCNSRCIFCSVPPFNAQPSFEELKQRIIKLKNQGTTNLILGGGEPTIRKDLIEIISFAKSLNYKTITMQSNGILLNSKTKIDKLFSAGLSELCISFHSHINKIYDELTNTKGSYHKALETLGILNNSGNIRKFLR